MTGQLFQLLDVDGENVGLIWTDLEGERTFQKEWEDYYNNFDIESLDDLDDINADGFCKLMNSKSNGYFERVYVTELNA